MESKKIVPIVVAIVILITGLFIFAKRNKKEEGYTALNVTYKNETKEYKNISVGLKLENLDAEIIATEGNKVVIRLIDGSDKVIKLNEEQKICKAENDCGLVTLK